MLKIAYIYVLIAISINNHSFVFCRIVICCARYFDSLTSGFFFKVSIDCC